MLTELCTTVPTVVDSDEYREYFVRSAGSEPGSEVKVISRVGEARNLNRASVIGDCCIVLLDNLLEL